MTELVKRRKEVEEAVKSKNKRVDLELISDKVIDEKKLISTGSTLLNLALSDNPKGGFYLGTISNIIGDSAAGKTFLLWSVFAEATYNKNFNKHELIFDEPESALEFNIEHLFGETVANRVKTDILSDSVESWHDNVLKVSKGKIPFMYGLDSLDAICPEDEIDRDIRKGTYGASKAKLVSEILRKIVQNVKGTNSTVFVISQTRDNIGVTFGSKKTRSGGKALKFFSTHEIWLAIKGHILRKKRDVGIEVRIRIGKNKLTGKLREVDFPIYYDYGIDDTLSCIRFLVDEGKWSRNKEGIIKTNTFFEDSLKEEPLAHYIESMNFKDNLIELVTDTWREIELSISTQRKPKYR